MEITGTKKNRTLTFTSSQDLANYVNGNPFENAKSKEDMGESFCKYSWEDTIDAFQFGWKESESIKINAEAINIQGEHTAYGINYDVVGDFLDIGTFLSGVPECWGNVIEEPKAMKRAKILIDCCASSGVKTIDIENRGSAIIAMIDTLRDSGYYLEITIAFKSAHLDPNDATIENRINFETDNSYSRDVLAFCCAHPGFLRRIGFSVMERHQNKPSLSSCSYGSPKEANHNGYDIHFQPIHQDSYGTWDTIEHAKNKVDKMIIAYTNKGG